jgi:hypothetical protein
VEFKIEGKLITKEEMSHREFIYKFTELLKSRGFHFAGETKIIEDKVKIYKKS